MSFPEVISTNIQKRKNIKDVNITIFGPHTWHTTYRHTKEFIGPSINPALIPKSYAISLICWGVPASFSQMSLGKLSFRKIHHQTPYQGYYILGHLVPQTTPFSKLKAILLISQTISMNLGTTFTVN